MTNLLELKKKIETKEALLAVVGLGYVGLPVACTFAEAGFDVVGVELRQERVFSINVGISPIEGDEPGLGELLKSAVECGKLSATDNYQDLAKCDVIIIAVETPVDAHHIPHYEALRGALNSLAPVLKDGALVIVESTIAPGTMKEVVLPLLENGSGKKVSEGFYLSNCPERVMPGRLLKNLHNVSRVVGGMTPETAHTAIALYRHIVKADLDPSDCVTAELVKTAENAYRDVQIAFANELALICEAVGGDVWKVRELVNKSPGRQMHLPGAGVGGHCIPKDPWLLVYGAKDQQVPVRLIPAARSVNDSMPYHVVDLVIEALLQQGIPVQNANILVMGYAYLENSDDTRNSPSQFMVQRLHEMGARITIHDPYVRGFQTDLYKAAEGKQLAILMVKHQEYEALDLERLRAAMGSASPVFIDGRHLLEAEQARQAGFDYYRVGTGSLEE